MPLPDLSNPDALHVAVFGPGQGECIVVRAAEAWVVIDSVLMAGSSIARRLLDGHHAQWSGLLLTHKHSDHVRGFRALLEQQPRGPVGCRLPPEPSVQHGASGRDIKLTLEAEKITRRIEDLWHREPETRWDLRRTIATRKFRTGIARAPLVVTPLWPPTTMRYPPRPEGWNAISTPLLIRWRGATALLGADLLGRYWQRVMSRQGASAGSPLFVKVPHHGSRDDQAAPLMTSNPASPRVVTPFASKQLPDYGVNGGVSVLLAHHDQLFVTSGTFDVDGRDTFSQVEVSERLRPVERSGGYASRPLAAPDPVESWWLFSLATARTGQRGSRAFRVTL